MLSRIKFLVFVSVIIFTFSNCQKLEIIDNKTSEQNLIVHENHNQKHLNYGVISLQDYPKLLGVINNAKTLDLNNQSRNPEFSNFLPIDNVDTDHVVVLTDAAGYSNYTFKILNDDATSLYFENLYLLETDTGYIGYILGFNPDQEWLTNTDNVTPEGDFVFNMADFEGVVTKYSLEREVIWSSSVDSRSSGNSGAIRGMSILICVFSSTPMCDYGGTAHPAGANCTGNITIETTETCWTIPTGGGGSSNNGDTGDGDNNSGGSGGSGDGDGDGDDPCIVDGTVFDGELPIGGVGSGCVPNGASGWSAEQIDLYIQLFAIFGNSFEFDDSISANNSISFNNLNDLQNYLSYGQGAEAITSSTSTQKNTIIQTNSFNIDAILDTKLNVNIKIKKNGSNDIEIDNIYSYLSGNTSFRDWTQNQNNLITIDEDNNELRLRLEGQLEFGLTFNGYGLSMTQNARVFYVFDLTTGELLGIPEFYKD